MMTEEKCPIPGAFEAPIPNLLRGKAYGIAIGTNVTVAIVVVIITETVQWLLRSTMPTIFPR